VVGGDERWDIGEIRLETSFDIYIDDLIPANHAVYLEVKFTEGLFSSQIPQKTMFPTNVVDRSNILSSAK
jgi:hypothetical protein